mgnify:CR=1 FL=1
MSRQPLSAKLLLIFLLSFALFLFLRLWNLEQAAYFIYDQGRDALKWAEIAQGELTLVGPTSGLAGFFIGPFWYYVGLPGFLLSGGHPLGVQVWYILLSALAFPGFWWLCGKLFWKDPSESRSLHRILMGVVCLIGLIALPASITNSTTIWNPLIGAPLMMGALFSFWKLRQDEQRKDIWLALGFLCTALTLQSEFAYAVFFLAPLFLVIPWMTQRRRMLDFIIAGGTVALTLLPQVLFELRNQFIMTRSLFGSLTDTSRSVSWAQQLQTRPMQLVDTTVDFFTGPDQNTWLVRSIVIGLLSLGMYSVYLFWRKNKYEKDTTHQLYLQQLLLFFALIPYPFFLIWRGNEGNFFWYYLTSHFIFIVPLAILGLSFATKKLWSLEPWGTRTAGVLIVALLLPFLTASIRHWNDSIGHPINETGYAMMLSGVRSAYSMQAAENTATMIITPNIHSQHYDYLFQWYGKKESYQIPRTVVQPEDTQLIVVTEMWGPTFSDYVKARHKELTTGWRRARTVINGKVIVQEWVR